MIGKNDYKEMEVKLNGVWQKGDVLKTLADGTCLVLMGNKVSNGNYMAGACVPAEGYREIPTTKKVVKSAPEIMAILIADGYEIDTDDGSWNKGLMSFEPEMWAYCGEEPTKDWYYEPEWLEEVPLNPVTGMDMAVDLGADEDEPLFI